MPSVSEPLPPAFPCPKCNSPEVLIQANIFIWMNSENQSMTVAKGYDWELASGSDWFCPNCEEGGPVSKHGPC